MKTIQVKPGKPSRFYLNNKRINLNTAFGMYQKGVKFVANGKKLNLNRMRFGMSDDGICPICVERPETEGCERCNYKTCLTCMNRLRSNTYLNMRRCPQCRLPLSGRLPTPPPQQLPNQNSSRSFSSSPLFSSPLSPPRLRRHHASSNANHSSPPTASARSITLRRLYDVTPARSPPTDSARSSNLRPLYDTDIIWH